MNFNIRGDKVDQAIVYLTKIDPYKPFGDFAIEVVSSTLKDFEAQYHSNNLVFTPGVPPLTLEVYKSVNSDKSSRRAKADDDSNADDAKNTQDETALTNHNESQGLSDKEALGDDQSPSS